MELEDVAVFQVYSQSGPKSSSATALSCSALRLISIAGCLAAGLLSLAPTALAEPGVGPDAILFGQAAALDGPAGALGQDLRTGILAAFGEVNRAGGIGGRRLELISRDD